MRLYSRRSEYVQRRELAALSALAVVLVFVVGIFTTGWLLDAAAAVGVVGVMVVANVLHRRRSHGATSRTAVTRGQGGGWDR